ncbi:MAG: MiaB/RimO family radical SAM methylthiotransferase [Chloroflexi bacterium]|nr:MiaB/RimO family radical SAM methylthiotransferase [Chloroflexota bacterium]
MRIYLDTLGCRLNQAEIERLARYFRAAGHEIVAAPEDADLAVLNTCAVTQKAVADSRQRARQLARAGAGALALTGCWVSLEPDAAAQLPRVRWVVPNPAKDALVAQVLGLPLEAFDLEPVAREPLPGLRMRTRAFVKVQDGCDNRCTFCITTVVRGPGRSRSVEEVLDDVRAALRGGAQEIVLTGVHLGSWGHDLTPRRHLRHLVAELLERLDIPRLRLSSLEPWDLDAAFFDLWQDARLARHLHLPLQSGSASTLRRMARKTTPQGFRALVEAARERIPEVAITTDIIVGFPGETEAEFAESLAFVESLGLAGGHVFTYSERPGTAAARMPGQVPHRVRKERNARMRAVLDAAAARYRSRFVGRTLTVLWERATRLDGQGWLVQGLSDNYLRVRARVAQNLWNRLTPVRIVRVAEDGALEGEVVAVHGASAAQPGPSGAVPPVLIKS